MANPAIVVDFLANTAGLVRAMKKAKNEGSSFGSMFKTMGKAGAIGGATAGVGALGVALHIGIQEFKDATEVAAQTNAVLKSTGGAANVTLRHVDRLAASISNYSGMDDEAIQSGENLLLTFTEIQNRVGKNNDIFDQATKATADLSQALGTDMKTAAMQVGKALNDPARGMSRLQRIGVAFTAQQKENVKALQATGDTAGAQRVILAELNKEFGGSAEAFGKTLPGQIKIAQESFNNFAGELVAKTIPVLTDVVNFIIENWPPVGAVIERTWRNDIKPTFEAIGSLVVSVVRLIKNNWDTIGPIVTTAAKLVENALKIITGIIKLFAALLRGDWSAAWDALKGIVSAALDAVLGILRLAFATNGLLVKAAVSIGKAILGGVVDGLTGIGSAAWGVIDNIGQWIIDKAATITGWGTEIAGKIVSALVKGLQAGASLMVAALKAPFNAVIAAFNAVRIPGFTIKGKGPLPDIHFGGIDLPWDIPKLAQGGIVNRPTLAMVGEAGPEAVIPLGRGGAPVEVRVFIGETELRGLVRTEVVTENNRVAQTLLAGAF